MTGSLWAPPRIADRASGRDNNFNLLRILAAVGVLVSHAYPLSLGPDAVAPLEGLLHGISLGTLGVMMFFSISGFFITRSFAQQKSLTGFFRARALRLFPALVVVLAITVLVAGFFLTKATPEDFWRAVPSYYLHNVTLLSQRYDLPGVFETNPYGNAINGSLWTLTYEVMCYLGVVLCGLAGFLARPRQFALVLLVFATACIATAIHPLHPRIASLMMLGLPFAVGMAFWVWRQMIPLSGPLALLALTVTAVVGVIPALAALFEPVFVLALAYRVFVIGYVKSPLLARYNRVGDYSYGTYVYAFPIQQMLAASGVVDPLANMAWALPATLFCAILSWHLIEAPAMQTKARMKAKKVLEKHNCPVP